MMADEMKPCPFVIGDIVRLRSTCKYYHDWRGVELKVIGIRLDRGNSLNIYISKDWPKDGGADGWSPDDLELVNTRAINPRGDDAVDCTFKRNQLEYLKQKR